LEAEVESPRRQAAAAAQKAENTKLKSRLGRSFGAFVIDISRRPMIGVLAVKVECDAQCAEQRLH
jgi:hypothetical protein